MSKNNGEQCATWWRLVKNTFQVVFAVRFYFIFCFIYIFSCFLFIFGFWAFFYWAVRIFSHFITLFFSYYYFLIYDLLSVLTPNMNCNVTLTRH